MDVDRLTHQPILNGILCRQAISPMVSTALMSQKSPTPHNTNATLFYSINQRKSQFQCYYKSGREETKQKERTLYCTRILHCP